MAEFLLEILSEEIPARMQKAASADLVRLVSEKLKAAGLSFDEPKGFVTPRRLVLVIDNLPIATPDVSEERRGPRDGAPAQALDGFLKSTGLALDALEKRDTGKGVFYFAKIESKGRPTAELLSEAVEKTMAEFPWPKSMRWGAHSVRWVRPIHSILALFDGKIVPVTFGPVSSSDESRGHRFHSPATFKATNFSDYAAKLENAKVVLDSAKRRDIIESSAKSIAASLGFTLRADEGLLDEVAGLVEFPVTLAGTIDPQFMDVPDEVLITSMRAHQKYFSLLKPDGRLANKFLVVANIEAADKGAVIIGGNERVLRARLSDARFFWDADRKARLESRVPKLAERLFYAKLGTMLEKAERVAALSAEIAALIGADVETALRAGLLAKADLSSEMVGEFPELQGIMGRYYALHDKEPAEIADAIAKHYAPQGPNDSCPIDKISIAVALADKIDSLTGFFAIDEKPTGSKDPFGLRRAALGVIRIILENGVRLNLGQLFARSYAAFGQSFSTSKDETAGALLSFFADRLKVTLKEKGVRHDLVDAVFALGHQDDLVRLLARVNALGDFLKTEDGANLLIAFRRAANIVRIEEKKDKVRYQDDISSDLLELEEEKALAQALNEVGDKAAKLADAEEFSEAMAVLAKLRQPVDAFFDKVTVNCEKEDLRINRLRLLARIGASMDKIADFSKIEG